MTAKKPAQKKRTTTTTVEETPQLETAELERDVFEQARAIFSDGARVKLTVYRYDDGSMAYLKRVDWVPDSNDEEWIRKKWGAGAYQLRFTDSENPSHNWSKIIEIAADASPQSQQPQSAGGADSLIVSMLQRQNEIMLTALVTGTKGSTPSPAGGNEAMVELIKGMQAQNTELLRAAMSKPDTSQTMLSVFEKGLAIAQDVKLDSEGGWAAQFGRIARELAPMLSEVAKARAENPRPVIVPPAPSGATSTSPARMLPATTLPGNGAPRPTPATPPTSGGTPGFVRTDTGGGGSSPPANPPSSSPSSSSSSMDDTLDLVDHALRQFAPEILQAAREGREAVDVADVVLQSTPPVFYPELGKLTPEKVIAIEPQLAQHRQFVVELLEGLKDDGDDGGES